MKEFVLSIFPSTTGRLYANDTESGIGGSGDARAFKGSQFTLDDIDVVPGPLKNAMDQDHRGFGAMEGEIIADNSTATSFTDGVPVVK